MSLQPNSKNATKPLPMMARARLMLIERLGSGGLTQMLVWAAVIGVLGALTTLLFTSSIHIVLWLLSGIWGNPEQAAAAIAPQYRFWIPAVGGVIAGLVLIVGRRFTKFRTSGGDYMEAIVIGAGLISVRQTLVRSFSSLISLGSGASIGREGPMVQVAAMIGSIVARLTYLPAPRKRLLVACGAAAGLTAAYNAPVAGALFVAEIVLGSIATESFGPLLVAAVFSNLTVQQFSSLDPLYAIPAVAAMTAPEAIWYLALGTVLGLCAPAFLRGLELSKKIFDATRMNLALRLGLGGLIVGIFSVAAPEIWGNGYGVVTGILAGKYLGEALLVIVLLKLVATMTTVGSGAIGGVFTPTLFVGAAIGSLLGHATHDIWPFLVPHPEAAAAVAMGAFLAATTHAPLMSILMIFEMTASDAVILPLMLACVPAYVAARTLRRDSIYSASLRKEAASAGKFSALTIADIFRPNAPTIAIDDPLAVVAEKFATHRFQYLYVIDASGRYYGAISLHDLRPLLFEPNNHNTLLARDLIMANFTTLDPETPLEDALATFSQHRGERLPVVSKTHMLLGAAWKTDFMLALHENLANNNRETKD